jgi:hypothetical protein
MAKSKYQALVLALADILDGIDQSVEKSKRVLQLVHFHFYDKILLIGAPLPSKTFRDELGKAHVAGMSILSPSQELRAACCSCSLFLTHGPLPQYLRSQYRKIDSNQPFESWWGVATAMQVDLEPFVEKGYWDTLLYCPDSTEISYEIDWFEKEDYANSLSFQMRSANEIVGRENNGKAVIRANLDQLALPHFHLVVEKWENDPNGHDTIPKDLAIVFTKPFAPTVSDYIAHAYEKVRRVLRQRSLRNYENLMILWRDFLENLMFTNVDWNKREKEALIKKWELNIFGCPVKRPIRHDGRWEQDMAID